jgi:hypothetical protein
MNVFFIDTLVYVGSLFVVNSFINALLDSYPVTWLAKVVALLPPVADSFKHSISTGTCGHNRIIGGAGVTVLGCISLKCKLDLYVLDGTNAP